MLNWNVTVIPNAKDIIDVLNDPQVSIHVHFIIYICYQLNVLSLTR